jgi:UDP-N-acetylmuramyl pentapeptide phosphotransferase/UDP-N-acetylglucosamine-1-phosphate transferase
VVVSGLRIAAVVLIVAGIAALAYGRFSYTTTREAKFGPIPYSVQEKRSVSVPTGAGVAALAGGVLLLLVPRRKRTA